MDEVLKVLTEVSAERVRQNEKWGQQNHNPVEWVAILTEEVGEVAKEAADYAFRCGTEGLSSIEADVLLKERLESYRTECIQVAAVAVQMVEVIDRQRLENTRVSVLIEKGESTKFKNRLPKNRNLKKIKLTFI